MLFKNEGTMAFDLKKLQAVAKPESAEELHEASQRDSNRLWMEKSALIALTMERILRVKGISKKELAEMLDVTPAQISKILSGKENLGLKTICKVEETLHLNLVNVQQDVMPYSLRMEKNPTIHVTNLFYNKADHHMTNNNVIDGFNLFSSNKFIKNELAYC